MADGSERVWVEAMAAVYDRVLVPAVFHPFAVDMARRVAARHPATVLELAAGTGVLTVELARAGVGGVVATDLNPAMVEVGHRHAPDAEWRTADAMELPFGDATFEVVTCQFGVMFLPDKPGAFREVCRVLTPGGTFLASVWGPLERHEFQRSLVDATDSLFRDNPPRFLQNVVHGYADPDRISADLKAGGLEPVSIQEVTLEGTAPSASEISRGFGLGTPLTAELQTRGDLEPMLDALAAMLERRLGTGPIVGQMTALVIEATAGQPSAPSGSQQGSEPRAGPPYR